MPAAICAAAVFIAVTLLPASAHAYPWMLRHQYTACNACHYDPSGAGAITPYGRAVAGTALQSGEAGGDGSELSSSSGFLFGALPTPEWLELGGDVRVMSLSSKTRGVPVTNRWIWMQLDAEATLSFAGFVASGSVGYAPEGALGAVLTRGTRDNVVSRQHWLGYRFGDSPQLFVRLGRMHLPFGIRTVEHTLWARDLTRTNINDDQQYGASVYFGAGPARGEVMAIAGNFQLRPDDYRERGYSAYLEIESLTGLAGGVSSLITHRELDTLALKETWRHAHGAFARWATPYEPLVLLTEWDYVFESSRDEFYRRGLASYLQADWEPVQGVHFLATAEVNKVGVRKRHWSWGGWLSYAWFFAPHCDVRLDGIYQSLGSAGGRSRVLTLLLQGHVFL